MTLEKLLEGSEFMTLRDECGLIVGELTQENGVFVFKGKANVSATIFFDTVCKKLNPIVLENKHMKRRIKALEDQVQTEIAHLKTVLMVRRRMILKLEAVIRDAIENV